MNIENSEIETQLRLIKRWIIVGAIGFLLTGVGVIAFSITMYKSISNFDNEFIEGAYDESSGFSRSRISRLIEKGKIEEALKLVTDHLETHPNNPTAHWLKARIHMIEEDWQTALKHVEKTELLAPNWEEEFTGPMRRKIEKELK